MIRKYAVPTLALLGLAVAIGTTVQHRSSPATIPVVQPAQTPFLSSIAASGIIEASTENIAIGTPVSGIVTVIPVRWGDWVNAGDVLFKIDDRDLQGTLLIGSARVREADARLAKTRYLLKIAEGLRIGASITAVELENRRFDVMTDEAALASANAQVEQVQIEIERRTVRAPIQGRILQLNIRPGEFAQSGAVSPPLLVLGNDRRLHVRVAVDENEAWRFRPDAPAMAFLRGNPQIRTPLRFERIEPLVIPKVSLTGEATERTDTRVLQVIFGFDHGLLPVYVGQQMDVFVAAPPVSDTAQHRHEQ